MVDSDDDNDHDDDNDDHDDDDSFRGLITFYQSQQSKDDFWLHIAPAILMVNAIATVCGQINDAAPRSKPQLHITHFIYVTNDSCCTVNLQTYSLLHGLSNQHDRTHHHRAGATRFVVRHVLFELLVLGVRMILVHDEQYR